MSKVSGLLHAVQLYRSGNDWHRCSVACVCHYVHTRSSHSDNGASGGLYPENKIVLPFYSVELIGRRHVTAAISYVLRNPVHHELTSNPYDYEFSSIGLYFRKETRRPENMRPKKAAKPFATIIRRDNRQRLPEGLIFDETGQIEPSQLVNSAVVEGFFGSYAAFDYGLQRRDYQVWETEQLQDRDGQSAITFWIWISVH